VNASCVTVPPGGSVLNTTAVRMRAALADESHESPWSGGNQHWLLLDRRGCAGYPKKLDYAVLGLWQHRFMVVVRAESMTRIVYVRQVHIAKRFESGFQLRRGSKRKLTPRESEDPIRACSKVRGQTWQSRDLCGSERGWSRRYSSRVSMFSVKEQR